MPEVKKFRVEIAAMPLSPAKQITTIEHCVDHFIHGGFYGVRTAEGKTYRFNVAHIAFVIEIPEC